MQHDGRTRWVQRLEDAPTARSASHVFPAMPLTHWWPSPAAPTKDRAEQRKRFHLSKLDELLQGHRGARGTEEAGAWRRQGYRGGRGVLDRNGPTGAGNPSQIQKLIPGDLMACTISESTRAVSNLKSPSSGGLLFSHWGAPTLCTPS